MYRRFAYGSPAIGSKLALLGYFLLGTVVYGLAEGWHVLDSVYFMIVTATTVGYGDLCPETQFGRAFTIAFLPTAFLLGYGIALSFIAGSGLNAPAQFTKTWALDGWRDAKWAFEAVVSWTQTLRG